MKAAVRLQAARPIPAFAGHMKPCSKTHLGAAATKREHAKDNLFV
jgi:hypothetical protein